MAAPAVKDRPSTKAQVRYVRMSASKARQVLDLIRGKSVTEADEVLALSEREAGRVIQKCLRSAVANAEHNDGLDPDELFVATCFADEGPTLRRFRPRARGRATRIRKRTCHITVVVGRYDADELAARRERERSRGGSGGGRGRAAGGASRRARVAKSRGEEVTDEVEEPTTDDVEEPTTDEAVDEVEESIDAAEAEDTTDADEEAPAEEAVEAEAPEELVEAHSKDELLEIAEEAGIDVAKSATKAEIAGAIEAGTATAEELAEHHSKDELLEIAEKAGVEVAKSWTKPQIAEAIVASREDD